MQTYDTKLGRYYQTVAGNFPSVSTIIRNLRPPQQQAILDKWRERTPKEVRDAVKERGNYLHSSIEKYFRTGRLEENLQIDSAVLELEDPRDYWQGIYQTLKGHTASTLELGANTLAIEYSIYHPELRYAGTLDWLGYWNGELTLIDFKTTSKRKRLDFLIEQRLQLAAYKQAVEFHHDLQITQTAVIFFVKNSASQIFYFEGEDLQADDAAWQQKVKEYHQKFPA